MSVLNTNVCDALDENTLNLLKSKNITRTTDFISRDAEDITELTGISYKDVVAIRKILLARLASIPMSGADLYNSLVQSSSIVSTGVDSIDTLLDGGLYTGEMLEVCGGVAAGKTQLCLSACGQIVRKPTQTAVYIDTGAAFSSHRLVQMVPNTDQDMMSALSRIQVFNAHSLYEVFDALEHVRQQLHLCNHGNDRSSQDSDFYSQLKLLVLDNVASVIYPLLGAGSFADNQGLLSLLGQKLKLLAVDYSIAVLVSNNTVRSNDGMQTASLGRMWSHVPHVRLLIDQDGHCQQATRTVRVIKSCRRGTGAMATFSMTENGPIR